MGWETTPFDRGYKMSIIKLERNGKIIERLKADYEANKSTYEFRGFKEYVENPKAQPKPEPKAEPKVDSEWQKEEEPQAKKTTKKAE